MEPKKFSIQFEKLYQKLEKQSSELKQQTKELKKQTQKLKEQTQKVNKYTKKLEKEEDYKFVLALIKYWAKLIIEQINKKLDLDAYYYKLNKNEVIYMIYDYDAHFYDPTKTHSEELDSESITQIENFKVVLEKWCGSLEMSDQIFEESVKISYSLLSTDNFSFENIKKVFERVKNRSKDENFKNFLNTSFNLWRACQDLNIAIQFPYAE